MQEPSPTQRAGMAAKAETKGQVKPAAKSRTLWGDAFKRLRKNKLAVLAVIWIIFVALVALTADLWAQDWLGSPTCLPIL